MAPFYEERGLEHLKIYLDPKSEFANFMGVPGLPVTFLVAQNREVVGVLPGAAEWDSPEALDLIRFYLDAGEKNSES